MKSTFSRIELHIEHHIEHEHNVLATIWQSHEYQNLGVSSFTHMLSFIVVRPGHDHETQVAVTIVSA
jgi:hypothetical protein